jgi:hypothetical protein
VGILAPGMLADFVVLSEDILEGPPARLLSARPLLTVMGGRDTYRDAEQSLEVSAAPLCGRDLKSELSPGGLQTIVKPE